MLVGFRVGRVANEQITNEWTVFSEAKVMIIQSMETIVGVVRYSYSTAGGLYENEWTPDDSGSLARRLKDAGGSVHAVAHHVSVP